MYIDEIIKQQPFWGEWVIENKIGEGSFGSVYMISRQDYTFVNKAAMKVICVPKDQKEHDRILEKSGSLDGAKRYCTEIRNRLLNEIKIMNQFKGNSQIVSMEDYKVVEATQDDFGFSLMIRMELCKTVNTFIDNKQDYFANASELIRLGVSICNALETIHSKSLLHRDIKPGNIFVSMDGCFKLGDFGMAAGRYSGEEDPNAAGTYDYMAPEVCNNLGYDARADLYSLGLTLYYYANGLRGPYLENVFSAPTRNDKNIAFSKRMKNEPILPPSLVPKPLADVILRACAFDQNERYMTARDMRIALISVERELYSSDIGSAVWQSGSTSSAMYGSASGAAPDGSGLGLITGGSSGLTYGSKSVNDSASYVKSGSVRENIPAIIQPGFDNKTAKKKKGLIVSLVSIATFLIIATAVVLIVVLNGSDANDVPDVTAIGEAVKNQEDLIDTIIGGKEEKGDNSVDPTNDGLSEHDTDRVSNASDDNEEVVDIDIKENDKYFEPEVQKVEPVLVDGSLIAYSKEGHILKGMTKDEIIIEATFMLGNETIDGEITLDCPEIITESGEYTWSFKPFSNELYNEVEGKLYIKTFIPDMIEGLEEYNSVDDKSEILYLSLENEGLTDVSFLAEAFNLEKLNLDDNNLVNFNGLENCEHLRTLAFNNNISLNDIDALLGLKELIKVYTDSTGLNTHDLIKLDEMVKENQNSSNMK